MTPEQIKDSIIAVQEGLNPTFKVLETWIGSGKITIDRVFEIGIRHNYAIAVSNIAIALMIIVFAVLFILAYKKAHDYSKNDCEKEWIFFPLIILAILLPLLFGYLINDTAMRIVAPEWSTINDFVKMLKNK